MNRVQTRCGWSHTKSAVFPNAVGPVTMVNSPSGNRTFKSFNSNRRSSLGAVKSMEIEPTSSLEVSLKEGSRTTVLVDEGSHVFPFTTLPVSDLQYHQMRQYDLEVKSILCVHSARAGAALLNGRERVSVETPQFWDAKILMESQNQMLSCKR